MIEQALAECGVEVVTGAAGTSIGADSITLSSGERIETTTVVWTAGARANPLAAQIAGEHDRFGRVVGDAFLRAGEVDDIFVTGDVVRAATDDLGNVAVMCKRHLLSTLRGGSSRARLLGWFPEQGLDQAA